MTHKQMLKQIAEMRKAMHKRLVAATVIEARGEKELKAAVTAFHKVHEMARVKNTFVKPERHKSLLDAIDKQQQKLVVLRAKCREVEKEHKAYFCPLKP